MMPVAERSMTQIKRSITGDVFLLSSFERHAVNALSSSACSEIFLTCLRPLSCRTSLSTGYNAALRHRRSDCSFHCINGPTTWSVGRLYLRLRSRRPLAWRPASDVRVSLELCFSFFFLADRQTDFRRDGCPSPGMR